MKGFTHYMVGLAAASFIPQAVREAASGNPLPMLAGGLFGILPDALDFKAARFFARHDMEIAPDPSAPDMQMVSDGLASAIAHARKTGKTVRVRLRTIQLGADDWQHYDIRFDPQGSVRATLGPVCNTGGRPLRETEPDEGMARVPVRLVNGYESLVTVSILDGPMLAFVPLPDGRVRIDFIPWHRAWSHSLVLAGAFGAALVPMAGWLMGLIAALGWAAHIVADQLGFLGSALFYPLSRNRIPGLQLTRSGDAGGNLAAVWLSGLAIFWNLARFASPPVPVNGARLLVCVGLIPLGLLALWKRKSAA
jgi:membrane-bound metal-dependent hydrolase YbcI (DUF457 family)